MCVSESVIYRYFPALSVLCPVQQNKAMFQVNLVPFEREDFTLSHARVKRHDDNRLSVSLAGVNKGVTFFF